MKITVFISLVVLVFAAACKQSPSAVNKTRSKARPNDAVVSSAPANQTHSAASQECKSDTTLLYQDEGISCYTEDTIRGAGVVSFQMDLNNRLDIYDLDGGLYGDFVLNEDGDFFTLDMPQKTIARQVIPVQDFAAFDFDAEPVNADQDYILIYVNKEKKKVKKAQLKYTYNTWSQYLQNNTIQLKACNLLKAADGKIISKSPDQLFRITAVKGDLIKIKSMKDCQIDSPYQDMQGWVKWRVAGELLIDFASCN